MEEQEWVRSCTFPGCTLTASMVEARPFEDGWTHIDDDDGHAKLYCPRHAKEMMIMAAKKTKKAKTNGAAKGGSGELHEDIRALLATGGVLHTKPYTRELPTPITAEEATTMSEELAETVKERKIVESDRREAMSEFREKLTGIKEHQDRLADCIKDHKRLEPVECIEVLLATNEIDVRRLDTGESVEVRAADREDLQQPLPGVDEDDDDEGGSSAESPGP